MIDIYESHKELIPLQTDIENAFNLMKITYFNGGKFLLCGNGGSSADCEHIVGELMKGFLKKRPITKPEELAIFQNFKNESDYFKKNLQRGIPAISLCTESALISAFSNDVSSDMIYAQEVFALGKKGDTLIAISTSGNSKNVVNAAKIAKSFGLCVISLTGANQSELSKISDITIKAPATETYRVQEYHLPIYHYLCAKLEETAFGEEFS